MRKLYFILFLFIIFSCEDDQLLEDVILIKIEEDSVIADGASSSKVTVTVDKDTDDAYKTLILKTSSGTFSESESDEITISDWLLVDGNLVATTTLVASCSATTAYVSASVQNQIIQDSIEFTKSEPCKIVVSASALSVNNSFYSEITISAKVKNKYSTNASKGIAVNFIDWNKTNNSCIDGSSFNYSTSTIDCNATTSVQYSPGFNVNPGDEVSIYAYIEGSDTCFTNENIPCVFGLDSTISDFITIFIKQN